MGRSTLGERLRDVIVGGQRTVSPRLSLSWRRRLGALLPSLPLAQLAVGTYEPDTTLLLKQLLRPGMTIVDVGANIGYYTILSAMSMRGRGSVYSFEPDPHLLGVLHSNVHASGYSGLITIVPMAASDRHEKAKLFLGTNGTTSLFPVRYEERESVIVEAISLDAYFADLGWPRVDLVKMDIEGAEKLALKGMKELVSRNPHMELIVEFCPNAIEDTGGMPDEFCDALLEAGFRQFWLIGGKLEPVEFPRELPQLVARVGEGIANLLCKPR